MPEDPSGGIPDFLRRVVEAVAQDKATAIRQLSKTSTAVPAGYDAATRWEQLESYLDNLRGKPEIWNLLILYWGQPPSTPAAALRHAVKENTRLETMLAKAGRWDGSEADWSRALTDGAAAVRAYWMSRRTKVAQAANDDLQQIMDKPPIRISPAIQVYDPWEAITQG
jgi:hypothetical protein